MSSTEKRGVFDRFAIWTAQKTGTTPAFIIAFAVIIVWAFTGPIFKFSDTWQLVINTGTTIVTFLMVFLIQHAQNRDSLAFHLKLNELVAAMQGASNRLVSVEDLSDDELEALRNHYRELALLSKREESLTQSHSAGRAQERHQKKHAHRHSG